MATKLRLQRHGKKGKPFYHLVVADARATRDGKFIEKLGVYNPCTNPATIEIDLERALTWVQNGAQPTETVRAILSYKGVLYKNHLVKGIKKGALTQEQADAKFAEWTATKDAKVETKISSLSKAAQDAARKQMADEKAKNEARMKAIEAANNPVVEEAPTEVAASGEEE